jgi:TolB-like protein
MKPAGKVIEFGPFRYDPGQHDAPSAYLPHQGEGYASLAAIPFDCLPDSPKCTAFSLGFNEELVAKLSKLDGVHVIFPSAVRRSGRACDQAADSEAHQD